MVSPLAPSPSSRSRSHRTVLLLCVFLFVWFRFTRSALSLENRAGASEEDQAVIVDHRPLDELDGEAMGYGRVEDRARLEKGDERVEDRARLNAGDERVEDRARLKTGDERVEDRARLNTGDERVEDRARLKTGDERVEDRARLEKSDGWAEGRARIDKGDERVEDRARMGKGDERVEDRARLDKSDGRVEDRARLDKGDEPGEDGDDRSRGDGASRGGVVSKSREDDDDRSRGDGASIGGGGSISGDGSRPVGGGDSVNRPVGSGGNRPRGGTGTRPGGGMGEAGGGKLAGDRSDGLSGGRDNRPRGNRPVGGTDFNGDSDDSGLRGSVDYGSKQMHGDKDDYSIVSSGTHDKRVVFVKYPGVPRDAFKWKGDYGKITSSLDLPRIFPRNEEMELRDAAQEKLKRLLPKTGEEFDDAEDDDDVELALEKQIDLISSSSSSTTISKKITVCVFNRAPRQRSLWSTGILSDFGSGKYEYKSMDATDCQFFGTCATGVESRKHPECDPDVSPTVGLAEWVKCCFHDRFENAMKNHRWDVAVATGDEYCAAHKATNKRADFRFYYSGNQTADSDVAKYLPLGPREEFRRVKPRHVKLSFDRTFLFNFVGSLTSRSRKILANVLRRGVNPTGTSSFLHVIGSWSKQATRSNGYILPHEYRQVLLNSTFTLCPDGHNPEAYRIYEALEAGSIPIMALDQYYKEHACTHAFAPFIQSGAPFVFLNGWQGLGPFLASVQNKPGLLKKMQADAMAWYAKWMQDKALEFEKKMEERFAKRSRAK